MTAFFIPDFDSDDAEGRNLCETGRQDCTATKIRGETSKKSGRPMMVVEWTVDNGQSAGHTLTEYITFGLSGLFGEAKLKRICNAAKFRWERRGSLTEFISQFPEGRLRASVLVEHQFSIDRNGWETVGEETFNSYQGKKNIRAVVVDDFQHDYKAAQGDKMLATEVVTEVARAAPVLAPTGTDRLPF